MLLALSVIVSLIGIVNTLILSIYERTRELGMMRAIGTSRRQIRQMIRYESVITALIGGVLGLIVGIIGAVIDRDPLSSDGYVQAGRSARCSCSWSRRRSQGCWRRPRRPAGRRG